MATIVNSQSGNGEYRLQFETDDKDFYVFVQAAARACVDMEHDRLRASAEAALEAYHA